MFLVIQLPAVSGRIDHLAFNQDRQVVYVAALGNNTVEVIDVPGGKLIHSIKDLHEPQGIEYLPYSNSIFVKSKKPKQIVVYRQSKIKLK